MRGEAALKAISEPRRQQLLTLLRDRGQMSVGELAGAVEVTQQAVSLHLKVLVEAGLVEARRQGTRKIYAVRIAGFEPIHEFVESFWGEQLGALKRDLEQK